MLTDVSHICRSEPILATLQHPVIVVRIEEVRGSIPRSSTTSNTRIRTAEAGPYCCRHQKGTAAASIGIVQVPKDAVGVVGSPGVEV